MIVDQLRAEDMDGFIADPRMKFAPALDGVDYWRDLAANGWAWSIKDEAGTVRGAAGLYRYDEANPRLAEMWAVFAADAGALMVGVTRRTLAVLEAARGELDLIRAHVERSFPQSRKWVVLLGFAPTGESVANAHGVFDLYHWTGE